MIRYIIKRILWLIPVIIAVSFIVFALMDLTPGTIVDTMLSEAMTQEDIDALRSSYDLDKPMIYRYGKYMLNLVQGDLGVSHTSGISVWKTYISRLPNTLLLSFTALIIGAAIALPMGIRAARRAGSLTDNATTTFTLIGMSMPSFWVGLLLLLLFAHTLGWFPAGGNRHGISSLILPAVCSGLVMTATATRQTRSSMLEVLNADYLRTARAKGVPEKAVIRRDALGNAMIPILTALGSSLGVQLAGSVVVESVFAWPGVGRMAAEAVMARDVPSILGCVILTTVMYVLVQLIVDLLYAFFDPRIRSRYAGAGKKRKRGGAGSSVSKPVRPGRSAAPVLSGAGQSVLVCDAQENSTITGPEQGETSRPCAAVSTVCTDGDSANRPAEDLSNGAQTVFTEPERDSDMSVETAGTDGVYTLVTRTYRKRSLFGEVFYRLRKNKGAMVGLIILALLFLIFIASVIFINIEMVTKPVSTKLSSPSAQYPFGTDGMGRNAFLRVLYGTRYSLSIGFGAVLISAVFGVILGSFAGYFGGLADDIIMRCSDVLASIPGMLFGMVLVTVLGQSLQNLILAVGITGIPVFIRITKASVLTVKNNEFVEAAHANGFPNIRIIFTEVLPNALAPIIVTLTTSLGIAIIVAASLSYLGFGVPVPHPEWGALISASREYLRTAPHLMTFPGLFIMLTVLAFNMLGDGLRDALDPKLKK